MKKVVFAGLLVLSVSSMSLAQSDSLPAATSDAPCKSATCTEPCQPLNCNSPCQSGPCATLCCPTAVVEPFVPKWAVGMEVWRFIDLPGTFVLERLRSKSSIEYYLSLNHFGYVLSDGTYLENKTDDSNVRLGLRYKRDIVKMNENIKLTWGMIPELLYSRQYRKVYYGTDPNYRISNESRYGINLGANIQACAVKDVNVKNMKLRNELKFIPFNIFCEVNYLKDNYNFLNNASDTTIEKIQFYYGAKAISKGSVSYSLKYLF